VTEAEYDARALPELAALVHALDALEADDMVPELAGDILTIEFTDGVRYVVNSHRAARQIWMAAERNAWHFDWSENEGRWLATKTAEELWSVLEGAIQKKLGSPMSLVRAGQ